MNGDKLYLIHIGECVARIGQYTAEGRDFFFTDTKTQDAVLRNLQVLSESTQRLSLAIKAAHPDVDWQGISRFRNVLTHNYLGINLVRVWEIIEGYLPQLKHEVLTMLHELGEDS